MKEEQINALPECIRDHVRSQIEVDAYLRIEPADAETYVSLAWRRWSGNLSNDQIADFLMLFLRLMKPGDYAESAKVREAVFRIRKFCSYRPKNRSQAERELMAKSKRAPLNGAEGEE